MTFQQLIDYKKANSLEEAFHLDFQRFSKETHIYAVASHHHFTECLKQFSSGLEKKITFLNPSELLLFQKENNELNVFIMPEINFTIFNVNFDRITNKEFGTPYFVAIKNKQNIAIQEILISKGFSDANEPFALFPHVARYFFESSELLNWLKRKSCPEPHSIEVEKTIFSTSANHFIQTDHTLAFYNLFKNNKNSFYDHYPMHLFYKNYLNINLNINITEQALYEF